MKTIEILLSDGIWYSTTEDKIYIKDTFGEYILLDESYAIPGIEEKNLFKVETYAPLKTVTTYFTNSSIVKIIIY